MPTVNEIVGLRLIAPRLRKEWFDEVVVIDLNSTDGTIEFCKSQGWRVVHQQEPGITNAYREVMPTISDGIIVTFSPDGNSLPERIPYLLAKMDEGYDMVIVSRYMGGAKSYDDDSITRIGNWIFTKAINFLFGGKYTDSLVMFRAFRKYIAVGIPHDLPRAGFDPFSSIKCAKLGLKVCDIPGDEPKRVGSPRKMNPLLNGIDIIRLIWREKMGESNYRYRLPCCGSVLESPVPMKIKSCAVCG